jgi:hypothetical protein
MTSLHGERMLSFEASLVLNCWKEQERETLSKKKTKKRNARWFLVGNEEDIYSLGDITPLQ